MWSWIFFGPNIVFKIRLMDTKEAYLKHHATVCTIWLSCEQTYLYQFIFSALKPRLLNTRNLQYSPPYYFIFTWRKFKIYTLKNHLVFMKNIHDSPPIWTLLLFTPGLLQEWLLWLQYKLSEILSFHSCTLLSYLFKVISLFISLVLTLL